MSVKPSSATYYRVTGSGSPVVFLHGAGGSGQLFAKQFQALRHRFRSYFLDLPGHGKSPPILKPDISNYARALESWISDLKTPVTVVGHSMGGAIALELAVRRPALVERLV